MQNKKNGNIFSVFGNPGQVIRIMALIVFFGGIIASIVFAWIESYTESEYVYSRYGSYYTDPSFEFGTFIGIVFGGSIGAWFSGLMLMTIGDTVLNIKRMADKVCEGVAVVPVQEAPAAASASASASAQAEKPKTVSTPVANGKDVAEQIKELAGFYQNGDLTEEEFARKKAELLKKL